MSRGTNFSVGWGGRTVLALGYAFLYLPILILIIFSFNESRLATTWSGFSLKWYVELFKDDSMLSAAWISLKIAFFARCARSAPMRCRSSRCSASRSA